MDQQRPNFFSGRYVDRRSDAREDPEWVAAARADSGSRYLLSRGSAQLVHAAPGGGIAFLDNSAPLVRAADAPSLVLLGWFRG